MSRSPEDDRLPAPVPREEAPSRDTEADAPRPVRPPRVSPEPQEGDPKADSLEPAPSVGKEKVSLPKGRARLHTVQIYEAAVRRRVSAERARFDPLAPHESQRGPVGLDIMFVRMTDRAQRAVKAGRDGVRVFGEADGHDPEGRPSTLTLGIEGTSFTTALVEGFDPSSTVEALSQRLAPYFELEVHLEGEGSAFIRLLRERPRP